MTALVFVVQSDQVCLAMDTLVVGHRDKQPLRFQRKFQVIERSGVVIAGAGLGNMVESWFRVVSDELASQGIDNLETLAPEMLQRVAQDVQGHDLSTSSMFHFGWSQRDSRYRAFVCRSTGAWNAESIPDNHIRMRPEVPLDPSEPFVLPMSFIDVVLRQQALDRAQPIVKQQGIGGELEFVHMHDMKIEVHVLGQLPGYDAAARAIAESRK